MGTTTVIIETSDKPLSNAARRVLTRAARRERGNVCPIVDTPAKAAAEMALLRSLHRRGFITDLSIPFITDAGRAEVTRVVEA